MDDLEREPEGLTYPPVTDAERARRREAALIEGPPTCSCGKATSFDGKVVGVTCGGLYLRGWYMCPDGHGTLASGLAEVCEAPTWKVAKGGRSVELGTGRLRWGALKLESGERLDVVSLMTRIARLPDLERAIASVETWLTHFGDQVSEHAYQELASAIGDVRTAESTSEEREP